MRQYSLYNVSNNFNAIKKECLFILTDILKNIFSGNIYLV
nr:MAG TPA: hypothetical protein [Bacteriophage sp.]